MAKKAVKIQTKQAKETKKTKTPEVSKLKEPKLKESTLKESALKEPKQLKEIPQKKTQLPELILKQQQLKEENIKITEEKYDAILHILGIKDIQECQKDILISLCSTLLFELNQNYKRATNGFFGGDRTYYNQPENANSLIDVFIFEKVISTWSGGMLVLNDKNVKKLKLTKTPSHYTDGNIPSSKIQNSGTGGDNDNSYNKRNIKNFTKDVKSLMGDIETLLLSGDVMDQNAKTIAFQNLETKINDVLEPHCLALSSKEKDNLENMKSSSKSPPKQKFSFENIHPNVKRDSMNKIIQKLHKSFTNSEIYVILGLAINEEYEDLEKEAKKHDPTFVGDKILNPPPLLEKYLEKYLEKLKSFNDEDQVKEEMEKILPKEGTAAKKKQGSMKLKGTSTVKSAMPKSPQLKMLILEEHKQDIASIEKLKEGNGDKYPKASVDKFLSDYRANPGLYESVAVPISPDIRDKINALKEVKAKTLGKESKNSIMLREDALAMKILPDDAINDGYTVAKINRALIALGHKKKNIAKAKKKADKIKLLKSK